ncbi:polypeptide N-acetylgalactosaminyltransferase 8 [Drosophila albomicans]|uniref:Polypeptide N-acetylgalactosaminyltransferase n=1 Tax=Drosophila albomicans TaxID=7291 RepID=A0A6P8WUA9_DROAB|nr:polypeptide N-acetylgalactosaminyltransferase 8 [Drosophila albomicans]
MLGHDMLIKHRKSILLLLLFAAICNIIVYLYIMERKTQATQTSTTFKTKTTIVRETETELSQLADNEVIAGLGAMGRAASGNWTKAQLLAMERSERETGYNAWLSEHISPERTLHDMRHHSCKKLKYPMEKLPTISVVIVQYNEQLSVLLRTLSSLRKRTSPKLLKEIILVDDGSDHDNFTDTLQQQFPSLLLQLRHPKQLGLMQARLTGARKAKQDVLVFLDAHVEVTRGWLPPLLAPLLENNKTCTTPVVDTIDYENFAYKRGKPSRGFFDWDFNYVQLPLLKKELAAMPAPHDNPIMNGGLFSIDRQWFFQLGGYDEGLRIWGAEQFELSLKIWLCGGRLLEVPCSRVGHLYRSGNFHVQYTKSESAIKAVGRNYRRVAEVWLDEYKDKLYVNMPHLTHIKVGSLSKQKSLRERLQCKPFKWFLDHLASDFLALYPLEEPVDYAFGTVQSVAAPNLCLDRAESAIHPQLLPCDRDLMYPKEQQKWSLSYFRDLHSSFHCLELQEREPQAEVWLWQCHHQAGNQFWFYDSNSKQLINGQSKADQRCMEAAVAERKIVANICNSTNQRQQWNFGYVDETRLEDFWNNVPET